MKSVFVRFAIIFLVTFFIVGFPQLCYDWGYRHGQIDALSGKARYVLTTQPNGETRWEEKRP